MKDRKISLSERIEETMGIPLQIYRCNTLKCNTEGKMLTLSTWHTCFG